MSTKFFDVFDFDFAPLFKDFHVITGVNTVAKASIPNLSKEEGKNTWSFEVPGFAKEDLKISLKGNTITISGEKKGKFLERKLEQTLILPKGINLETITAEVKDGILYIHADNAEKEKPVEIKIL